MSSYGIVLIVLFSIAIVIFLPLISFILIRNRRFRSQCEVLKRRFNNIVIEDFEKKNLPIYHIAFRDEPNLLPLQQFFDDFASSYNISCENIKTDLYRLSETIKNYDWKHYKFFYEKISNDLTKVEESIHKMNMLHQNILSYKNYVGSLLVSYRQNTKKLISFYEKNLSTILYDKTIYGQIEQLRRHSKDLDKFIDEIDVELLVETINDYNHDFKLTFDLLNNWYIGTKEFNFMRRTVNGIEEKLKTDYKNLNEKSGIEVEKKLTSINRNMEILENKFKNHDFKKLENDLKETLKSILELTKKLNLSFKSNEFLAKNSNEIIKYLKKFEQEEKNFQEFLNKINANFFDSKSIKSIVNNLKTTLNNTIKSCRKFIQNNSVIKNYSTELFNDSKKVINEIVDFSEQFESLIQEVSKKYSLFNKVVTEISSCKLLLGQMQAFLKSNEFVSTKSLLDTILKCRDDLTDIENNFFKNYNNDFESNYKNTLLALKEKIHETNIVISSNYYTKVYVEKLISYANIVMIKKKVMINLDEIYDLYNKGEYQKSLKLIVKILKSRKYKLHQ